MKHLIGGICLATTPTPTATKDILSLIGNDFRIIEVGGLDGLSSRDIEDLHPLEGDSFMTSNLSDGTPVVFAENKIIPRIQNCIFNLESQCVELIILYCGGDFHDVFKASIPILYPFPILKSIVPMFTSSSHVAILTPLPQQVNQAINKWQDVIEVPIPVIASPHEGMNVVIEAAKVVRDLNVDLAVLDCFGFTNHMKDVFENISSKKVLSSRSILAHAIKAIY